MQLSFFFFYLGKALRINQRILLHCTKVYYCYSEVVLQRSSLKCKFYRVLIALILDLNFWFEARRGNGEMALTVNKQTSGTNPSRQTTAATFATICLLTVKMESSTGTSIFQRANGTELEGPVPCSSSTVIFLCGKSTTMEQQGRRSCMNDFFHRSSVRTTDGKVPTWTRKLSVNTNLCMPNFFHRARSYPLRQSTYLPTCPPSKRSHTTHTHTHTCSGRLLSWK